jgi:hypothetical protein
MSDITALPGLTDSGNSTSAAHHEDIATRKISQGGKDDVLYAR